LVIITDKPLSLNVIASLKEDFSESDLPWKVDIVDWATTSEPFRKIIERDKWWYRKVNKVSVWRPAWKLILDPEIETAVVRAPPRYRGSGPR
jgi:type I restriction enzyme S subunit